MSKGVILEINGKHAIVLSAEGTFERTFSPKGAQVGDEITFERTVRKIRPLAKWVSVAACLMLGIGTWSYWNISSQNQVYAYVGIDINPSLELGINQSGKVLTVQALNDDAKTLLAGLSVQGEQVDQAVATVAKAAAAKGFVHQDSDIVITASPAVNGRLQQTADQPDNPAGNNAVQNQLLSAMEQNIVAFAQKTFDSLSPNVHVDALQVSPEFHSAAAKLGLPAAKYAFYLKANSDGHPVSVEELKMNSISKLESEFGIPRDFLKGETAQSLDVELKNWDQSGKGTNQATPDAPTKSDGKSQDDSANHPPVHVQNQTNDTARTTDTSSKLNNQADSGNSQADQHNGLIDFIKQKLHLKPQNKNYQDSPTKTEKGNRIPASNSAKDHSSKTGGNEEDNDKSDKHKEDSGNQGAAHSGETNTAGNESSDESKNSQGSGHQSADKPVKPIVKGSHTEDLNVGSTVYDLEKQTGIEGLFGQLLNKN